MKNYSIQYYLLLGLVMLCLQSCNKFLETKPDTKLAIPNTFEDCQALLDGYGTVNMSYPYVGELCTDDFSLTSEYWAGLEVYEDRMLYIWDDKITPPQSQWAGPYQTVYIANQVLSILETLPEGARRQQMEGAAYFYRAYALFALVELFAPIPLKDGSNAGVMALPYRRSPNIEEKVERVALGDFFALLIADLENARKLLPRTAGLPSRPNSTAAAALLSRIYLYMQDYDKALDFATAALEQQSSLIDYNTLPQYEESPFKQFNSEVIFQAIATGSFTFYYTIWKVSPQFYASYSDNDLRKQLFFMDNGDDTFSFKGNYDGELNQAPFCGLAVDELVLIKAECLARLNHMEEAKETINTLGEKRYIKGTYQPAVALDPDGLLRLILEERRKELVMRQRRWSDLKRLNLDPKTATTMSRTIDGKNYELKPNAGFYTMLIPQQILNNSTLTQTVR
jgi:starch-binding outer membrane protein, SusD/RagB family